MAYGIQSDLLNLIEQRFHARGLVRQWQRACSVASAGSHLSSIKGRGMDFDEVRHYHAGDDIRLMDWKVTARTGKPHIKIYREERERPVYMLVDQSSSMCFGSRQTFKSVLAAEIASLIGWKTLMQRDRLSCIILEDAVTHCFPPTSREQGFLSILKKLSDIKPKRPKPKDSKILAKGLEQVRQVVKPGAYIYIISDFYAFNQESLRHLSRLAQHANIFAFVIRDPLEQDILPKSAFSITNGVRELFINIHNKGIRKKLKESLHAERQSLELIFKKHQIKHLFLKPQDNVITKLRGGFL